MQSKKVFWWQIVMLAICCSGAASSYQTRHVSRRQKKLIEGSMDLKIEPCEDFFQYACGNWHQVFLEAGAKYYEPITLMDYNVNQELSQAFNVFRKSKKPKFIAEAYDYYTSCKNLKQYRSIKYLLWLKAQDNFKFPAIWTQPKNNTHFDWVQMLAKMRTYGFNDVFIQQIIISKLKDVRTFIIDLDKPVTDGGFQALTEINFSVLMESLPAEMTTAQHENLWQEISAFEEKLNDLDAVPDIEFETEIDYDRMRLLDVKNLPLPWLKDYLKVVLNQTELNSRMQLYVQNIPYMKALDELLKQYSQRFLCKYLQIRFLWYLHLNGPTNFIETDCLASTRSLMPIAMHWQYEQHHSELLEEYSPIYEVFNVIRKHFNNTVVSNKHGFNASVISYLQKKLQHMQLRLNNVPRVDTIETLEKYYGNLDLDVEQFYGNHLKLLRFNFLARANLLKSQTPIMDFTYLENGETGSSSSPYFVQNANTVFLPLSLLQQPIYMPGLEGIYKFSSLGFLLAHEMFHGFDDSGLLTDAHGSWKYMQFEENPLFNASLSCLLEINPDVVSEKIADISGLRYAYQAYFDSNNDTTTKTIYLHGNEISQRKLFFLNFAQFFCGKLSEAHVSTTEHGSDHERITDALSHFPEFAKEFNCKSNQKFYPHETCHLWRR